MGKKPHVSTAIFAKKYGPLISLRQGSQQLVVASSSQAAMEILKTKDQIFSAKAIEAQSNLRNEKLAQMLDFLNIAEGKVVKIEEVVFTTLFNTMSNILFSKDFLDLKVRGLDLQGLRKDTLKQLNDVSSFTGVLINERRDRRASLKVTKDVVVTEEKDFLDHLLDNNFTDIQINTLVQNKEIMKKVQEELKREINSNSSIMKFDFSKVTYFNACIKETLRLHPVVPLLIPRRAVETCEVMGHDFEFTPFGGGRRMCPGLLSGIKGLETILASLILGFNWVLPHGEDPANLDMNEHFGVTLQKEKPLELIFKRKE
ncbi:cytochrome P450 [Artemisia annua]|uniref:Cytochrome P450 n=1 Tax=Artemisia annua TaxID=35608 RepID=A0A2U1MEF9_ARTAN|nr:cytochrome P450 [Artemisia annua]